MKIQVTQKHINQALTLRKSAKFFATESCPIALALGEKFPGVIVGIKDVEFIVGEKYTCAPLPENAQSFVREFDGLFSGQVLSPFEFEVEVPA